MRLSESRYMCGLCAHGRWRVHMDFHTAVLRFGESMCGCAPQFSILRVTHMKRGAKNSITISTIGDLGRTPAHRSQKPLDGGPIQRVRPPHPMCAQGRTSTMEVSL